MRNYRYLGLVFTLLLAIVPAVGSVAEPTSDILPFKATTKTLPNGLVVIVVPTGFPNIVSLQIPVLTGSRNEVEPGKSGFAHFFEHMMFRGTPTLSARRVQRDHHARPARGRTPTRPTTTRTTTSRSRRKTSRRSSKIEADRFQNLSYPSRGVQDRVARGARRVQQELGEPDPEALRDACAPRRSRRTPTSTRRWASSRTSRTCRTSTSTRRPSSRAGTGPRTSPIIVAGDVDPAQVMPLVEKYWGGWQPGSGEKVAIPQEPAPKGAAYAHVPWQTPTAPWVDRRVPRPGVQRD